MRLVVISFLRNRPGQFILEPGFSHARAGSEESGLKTQRNSPRPDTNMENGGQTQQPGQETPAEVQALEERKRQEKGNRGPGDVPGFGQGA
jgi:hypothetical protein